MTKAPHITLLLKNLRKTQNQVEEQIKERVNAEKQKRLLEEEVEKLKWFFLPEGL
jgi:hypothetical protein